MASLDASQALGQASLALSQSQTTPNMGKGQSMAAMKKSATDFEAVFVSQMFSQMFDGVSTDGMFGGGHGEEMFRSVLIDEYGKQVAKHGGLGIGDAVLRTMIATQENAG